MTLLSLSHVSASYGSSQVLFDVNFKLASGEAMALLGRNGMGKSTSIKSICRMIPANGQITFDGKDLTRISSYQVARLGIGLVPEGRRCFAKLTVVETEGLAPILRQEIWSAISTLKSETGLSLLVIDKSINELSKVCDKVAILERGITVWQGEMQSLTQKISQKYVGV